MRDTILASLVLASATLASAGSWECLHTRSRELAIAASCGDEGSLSACFSHLPASNQPEALSSDLERCFVSAGCTPTEAHVEAFWAVKHCDVASSSDLRRHRRQPDDDAANILLAKDPLVAARNPLAAAGPAITAMRPRQDTAATVTTTASQTSPSPCFTDTSTDVSTCTTLDGGSKTCFLAPTTAAKCRDGLICQFDMQGNPSCMYKHSSLDVGGIIIASVFAAAVVAAVIGICFMCCRERREHRRIDRAAEAARIAKEAKSQATAAAKRPGVSVTGGIGGGGGASVEGQPLMYQGEPQGQQPQQYYAQQGQQQPPSGYGGANPFADTAYDAHPLR